MKAFIVGGVLIACTLNVLAQTKSVDLAPKTIVFENLLDPKSPLFCPYGVENIPIPHFPSMSYLEGKVSAGTVVFSEIPWPALTKDIHEKLPNTSTEIATTSLTANGVIAALFKLQKDSKSFAIDYIKYRIEPMSDGKTSNGYVRVGIGMRILVDLNSSAAGFTGTLSSLAASVKGEAVNGTISAELIGISSPEVGMAMPFTADLSESSIQRVIEAMAVVKSRMFDSNTVIQPQLISRISCKATSK